MATVTETPEQALQRIQGMGFGKNDAIVIMAFADRGIDPESITPRDNVLTFRAWKAAGRQVAKGATGVPITTWVPCKERGDGEKQRLRPKSARLFHISQTIPKGAPKGTRPDAWQNPALVKEGTYQDTAPISPDFASQNTVDAYDGFKTPDRPLRPDVTLSTGKTIKHARETNGSQAARPAMTPEESNEYDQTCTCPMAGYVTNVDCPIHGERAK